MLQNILNFRIIFLTQARNEDTLDPVEDHA